jgi:sigma-54 dependent transcriptional regulator, acetoin dehydrogenase operon transcriptional activator AcoR
MSQTQPATLPNNLFFATPQQRLALARQRYFEDGVRPSGLVSEAVIQSWQRCLQARHDPARIPGFNAVTTSRIHGVLGRSRALLQAAANELDQLRATLAGTTGTAILTDAHGVVVGTTFSGTRPQEVMMKLGARVGVNLAEEAVGTTAPGITARTGQASVVLGCEHFFNPVQVMYCAAAPIHDVQGRLAGVLDLSSELVPFNFDAASVVGLYATAIENRLLRAQAADHLVLQLQVSPDLLDTPMAGLVGITSSGRIAWLNGAAGRLLGVSAPQRGAPVLECEQVLGQSCAQLAALTQAAGPSPVQLPNGLMVWVRASLQARDGATRVHAIAPVARPALAAAQAPVAPAPAAAVPAGTLRELDRHLVTRTLETCGGNVSKAARQLGVSRGLIYRHLQRAD